MGQDNSKCKAVIELKGDDEIVYNVEGVKEMIRNGPAGEDTKVFVICISGVYRSGKSFLLNLLKTYVDHYCEHSTGEGWVDCRDSTVNGGNWAQGEQIVTHGIQMYMYPKLINEKAVILMDCQGTGGVMKSTPAVDNLILFLGLQLSDVHILNVDRSLRTDDLDRLHVCVFHGKDDSCERSFGRQIFLIRNWGSGEEPQQLETLIETSSSESVKSMAEGIKNTFKAVEVDTLPYPGESLDGRSESDNICLGDVAAGFLKKASELFHRLILVFPSEATMSGAEFISLFESLSKRDMGKIRSTQEVYEESMVKDVYTKSIAHFKSEVEQFQAEKQKHMTTEQLEERVTGIYEETERMFNDDKRVRKCKKQQVKTGYLGYLKKEYGKTLQMMKSAFELEMLNHEVQKQKQEKEAATKELNDAEDEIKKLDEEMEQSVEVDNDTHGNAEVEGHIPKTEETTQDVAGSHSEEVWSQVAKRWCQLENMQEVMNQRIRKLEATSQKKWDMQANELCDVKKEIDTLKTDTARQSKELEVSNQNIANLERDKVQQEQELKVANQKIAGLERDNAQQGQELCDVKKEIDTLKTDTARQSKELEVANPKIANLERDEVQQEQELEVANQMIAGSERDNVQQGQEPSDVKKEIARQKTDTARQSEELKDANPKIADLEGDKVQQGQALEECFGEAEGKGEDDG